MDINELNKAVQQHLQECAQSNARVEAKLDGIYEKLAVLTDADDQFRLRQNANREEVMDISKELHGVQIKLQNLYWVMYILGGATGTLAVNAFGKLILQ